MVQASSEHPLGKAIVEYARHFHFFDEPSAAEKDVQKHKMETKFPGWLLDVSDFSAVPGKGVKCFIYGKQVLVSLYFYFLLFFLKHHLCTVNCPKKIYYVGSEVRL